MEQWGPVGAGSVTSTHDKASKKPVMIKFVWGKKVSPKAKRIDTNGVVLATTIALEKGHSEPMANLLSFWKTDKLIPTGEIVAVIKDRDPFGKPSVVDWLKAKAWSLCP